MAARKPKKSDESNPAVSYNELKIYEGRRYTGMKVGRSHKWYYDKGEWKETKITPDLWEISYAVTKRRAGKAPEGSGVPVGTEYHWYILAHQNVTKLNANEYTTSLTGMKFKLAHRRADKGTWSASVQAQRRHLIKILKQVSQDLEHEEAVNAANAARAKAAGRTRQRMVGRPPSKRAANGKHTRAA